MFIIRRFCILSNVQIMYVKDFFRTNMVHSRYVTMVRSIFQQTKSVIFWMIPPQVSPRGLLLIVIGSQWDPVKLIIKLSIKKLTNASWAWKNTSIDNNSKISIAPRQQFITKLKAVLWWFQLTDCQSFTWITICRVVNPNSNVKLSKSMHRGWLSECKNRKPHLETVELEILGGCFLPSGSIVPVFKGLPY